MKIFLAYFLSLVTVSCHSSSDSPRLSHVTPEVQPPPPKEAKAPQGRADYEGNFPIPMVEDYGEVEHKLRSFKIVMLNGYCDVEPRGLSERESQMTFDGKKLEVSVKRESCVEVVERDAHWTTDGMPATLFVSGGRVKASCTDQPLDTDVYQAFHFDLDATGRFVAVYSTIVKGCWWAKRID